MSKASHPKGHYTRQLYVPSREQLVRAFALVVGVSLLLLALFRLRALDESDDSTLEEIPLPPAIVSPASLEDAERCLLISPGGTKGYSLRDLLNNWPIDKPKAFIYTTVNFHSVSDIAELLKNVFSYFNKRFDYPFIIFTESQELANATKAAVSALWPGAPASSDDLPNGGDGNRGVGRVFVYVTASLMKAPAHMLNRHGDDLNEFTALSFNSIMRSGCLDTGGLTFWLTCRFHSKGIAALPFVRGFEYMWRLEVESRLCEELSFDIFRLMKDGQYWLGYIIEDLWDSCAEQLTEAVHKYVRLNGITPAQGNDSIRDARTHYVYSNFEIARVQFFLTNQYRKYINYIDLHGGIFYYRWCDGPVKSQAYRLFMPKSKMRQFKTGEVFYRYQSLDRCRREVVGRGTF